MPTPTVNGGSIYILDISPPYITIIQYSSIRRETTHFRVLDVSKPIEDFQLCTGAVLIIQARYREMAMNVPMTGLAFGPRGRHEIFPKVGFQHLLPKALFEQALHGECTDVIISSFHESAHTFQFTVHKNVMSVIPYFKSAFTVGMSESTNMHVVKLELQGMSTFVEG